VRMRMLRRCGAETYSGMPMAIGQRVLLTDLAWMATSQRIRGSATRGPETSRSRHAHHVHLGIILMVRTPLYGLVPFFPIVNAEHPYNR
jgi:hypothetical protein